ncbi:Putative O-methyltransferase/MSMEI_4947 (plasmid) [Streptomyces xanthophaeus]|uniref:O-methyltransferase n=1 Tax=Streptomyces xanthophaeus TaxID=67385 RepID=UPI00233E74D3|nr:class I SAM-dependent methyltransferase [Streptomyces xanthophaeus]WCD91286.1 Putative O-methyltransferase/MSMEI_4947 [Streptomyces xanthophaeus]
MERTGTAEESGTRSLVTLTFGHEMSRAEIESMKRRLGARTALQVPPTVDAAYARAQQIGFAKSCCPEVGALMSVLAAATPTGGRILELGTGVGVGLAWIVHGLHSRTDVEVVSVEVDPKKSALASGARWPDWVTLVASDAKEALPILGRFDLIFLDVPGQLKASLLDGTINALKPGGQLLIDDMNPYWGKGATRPALDERDPEQLLEDSRVACALLQYATGMILASRLPD